MVCLFPPDCTSGKAIKIIGVVASSCDNRATAQNFKADNQNQIVNNTTTPPAPAPEDSKRQFPPTSQVKLGFPPPSNPEGDIGEQDAAQRAKERVVIRYGESNSKVISNSRMSYKEALKLEPEPIEVSENDALANTQVRVLEISGNFQARSRRQREGKQATVYSYTRGYIILRAADGIVLVERFFK